MKPYEKILLAGALGMAAGAAIFFWSHENSKTPQVIRSAEPASAPATGDAAKAQYPVAPESEKSEPGSAGKDAPNFSGATFESALVGMFGQHRFDAVFNSDGLIRHIVIAVDNATAPMQPAAELSPLKPLDSAFIPSRSGTSIAPENYQRYIQYMGIVTAANPETLVAVYKHFYPQFQSAFHELGTDRYFNDRLVEVIDHLLQTPEVKDPPRLVRPSPRHKFKYADDDLENLSSSQKALIRMGPENAELIKTELSQYRKLLLQLGKKSN